MPRILVIRFSSMGDVLLTAPVIRGVLEANPEISIDLLTKKQFVGYFQDIDRLNCIPVDTENRHKGLPGLIRLSGDIIKTSIPDIVIDLHCVIRSRIITFLLSMRGIFSLRIEKGRKEKKAYIKGIDRSQLKHTSERYRDVFVSAGIEAPLVNFPFATKLLSVVKKGGRIKMGLAPYARHTSKSWPLQSTLKLMNLLATDHKISFSFYGSKMDAEKLSKVDFGNLKVQINAGGMTPAEEIKSISELDIFFSMDSANMHLADLIGIPVISAWGGTHPDIGFRALNQPDNHNVKLTPPLPCQPCSVYGNKACSLKDSKYQCLSEITPEMVLEKILSVIQS